MTIKANKRSTMRDGVIESYRRLLDNFNWEWFVTLKTMSGAPSSRREQQLLRSWLAALRAEGAEDFRYFWVMERGKEDAEICFHVLIGGLRNRVWVSGQKWEDATIMTFDPNSNDILSILKSATQNGTIEQTVLSISSGNPHGPDSRPDHDSQN